MKQDFVIRRSSPEMETQIVQFFSTLAESKDAEFFQPHPFTPEQAYIIANYEGRDFYAIALYNDKAIAYGMLRGWDEGYEIPSLGISIHPEFRGAGIGLVMMHYLHAVATLKGATKMRLRVMKDNLRAKSLYEKLGYEFEEENDEYVVGFLKLKQHKPHQPK